LDEGNSLAAVLFESAIDLPRVVQGSLGLVELGWLDTPLPAATTVLMLGVFGGVVVLGVGVLSGEKALALGVVAGAIVVVPMVVLASGQNVQPRYILPLLPVLAGTALLTPRGGQGLVIQRAQVIVIVLAVVTAHGAALHRNIRRYVTGVDEGGPDLGQAVEWWWGWAWAPGPMATWALGASAFAVVAGCGAWLVADDQLSAKRVGSSSSSGASANS
jgi:hypothetical protein